MTTQAESKLSRNIMGALRKEGAFCFKVHGGPTMMAGLPDIVCCYRGQFVGLETKMPDKRSNTSPRQDLVHEWIREAEGKVRVVCSIPEALDILRQIDDELSPK